MIITQNQLKKIDLFLIKQGVDYVDVRYEILDHMICDIETIIKTRDVIFDDAFDEVAEKWKHALEETNNFWLGFLKLKPRIFVERHTKIIKPILLNILLCTLATWGIVYVLFELFPLKSDWYLNNYRNIIVVLFAVTSLFFGFLLYRLHVLKHKTVFSFIFKEKLAFLSSSYITLLVSYNSNLTHWSKTGQLLPLSFIIFITVMCLFEFDLYKKHLKTVKQYKVMN